MSTTTTPRTITDEIKAFCAQVNPNENPLFVKVAPCPHSTVKECFHNVREQVRTKGGEPIYGWTIWEWPSLLIEAEFHCVWKNEKQEILDITPLADGEGQILFLQDSTLSFNFKTNKRIHNIRRVITNDPLFAHYIKLCEKIDDIAVNVGPVSIPGPLAYSHAKAQVEVWKKYLNKNDRCPCGSGKKFKKCCLNKIT